MNRLLWLAVALAIVFFTLFALTVERNACPEGQVWVMTDNKWICVEKGGL